MDSRVTDYIMRKRKMLQGEDPDPEADRLAHDAEEIVAEPEDMAPAAEPGWVPPPEEAYPQRPVPELPAYDFKGMAEADERARSAGLDAGLGRAGQMFAQAFGAKNADPAYFDAMAKDASGRRDLVHKYLREKADKKATTDTAAKTKLYDDLAARVGDRNKTTRTEDFTLYRDKLKDKGDRKDADKKSASDLSTKLRTEILTNNATKDFQVVAAAMAKLDSAVKDTTAVGDIATVYSYMKLVDQSSSVKEGETAMAEQAKGVPSRILNLYNSLVNGNRLTPAQKMQFANSARGIYDAQKANYDRLIGGYRGIVQRHGLTEDDVIIPVAPSYNGARAAGAAPQERPPVLILKGKRFLLQPDGQYLPE